MFCELRVSSDRSKDWPLSHHQREACSGVSVASNSHDIAPRDKFHTALDLSAQGIVLEPH